MNNQIVTTEQLPYEAFIKSKVCLASPDGFEVSDDEINPILKPHQRACVRWAIRGGRRALFEAFGLGKTIQQLEILRIILLKIGGGQSFDCRAFGSASGIQTRCSNARIENNFRSSLGRG